MSPKSIEYENQVYIRPQPNSTFLQDEEQFIVGYERIKAKPVVVKK